MQSILARLAFPGWKYALAALIVIIGGWYFLFGRSANLGATLLITQGDFTEQVSVSGTVTAAKSVDLGFSTNGRIAGTYAKVGQHVTAGTILAAIENNDLSAAVAQKQAALTEAQANLASLRTGTRPEEIAVASTAVSNALSALIDALQSAYTVSDDAIHNRTDAFFTNPRTDPKLSFTVTNEALKSTVERDRISVETTLANWTLLAGNLTSANAVLGAQKTQEYLAQIASLLADANAALNQSVPNATISTATLTSYATSIATARTNVDTAATTLTTDLTTLGSAEKNLTLKQAGATNDAIAAQEAAVAAAAADVANAQAALAKTRVVAPFSGRVTRMDAKTGETVSPTTSLIGMQSDGVFQIETYVPEVTIARVAVGNPATTTLDAYGSSVTFPSVVVAVDPAETMKDGVPTYKTTLSFLSEDSRIRSGMTTNIIMETGKLHNAIVIPAGAVGVKNGVSYVSVVDHTVAVNRTVTTGLSPALGQAEILSGLTAGDVILLSPAP